MNYSIIADAYEKIEATSKRLEMIDLLVKLLKITPKEIIDKVIYLTEDYVDKTPEGEVLDKLQLTKMCCRRHLLTHVDID